MKLANSAFRVSHSSPSRFLSPSLFPPAVGIGNLELNVFFSPLWPRGEKFSVPRALCTTILFTSECAPAHRLFRFLSLPLVFSPSSCARICWACIMRLHARKEGEERGFSLKRYYPRGGGGGILIQVTSSLPLLRSLGRRRFIRARTGLVARIAVMQRLKERRPLA